MSNLNNQFSNAISNLNLNSTNLANNNASTATTTTATTTATTALQTASSLPTQSNVILQTLKRRNTKVVVPLDERVTLEKAFGFTITSNSRLTQSSDGLIAYLAGCVIVLYDKTKQSQEFIISQARKTLTCVAFSADARCLATGESGHEPKVRVWDVKEKIQLCEFTGHKFSIECVCFSTNLQSNLIVSIGSIHDMVVNVWNLRTKFKVASNKIACKVKGIAFTRDGSFFVTVGNRHVKYWYLTVSSLMETVPLKGRAAILSDMRNSYFCDVVCGTGECVHSTYTITTNGMLCEFNNEQRCITRSIELRTEHAYCIYADNKENLFIGCSNGTILIFKQKNLDIVASLPRPHNLGVDISKGFDTRHIIENLGNHELKYPDCVALCYDNYDCILSAIYNDHSFYVWDIKDLNKVKKVDSHLFHSSCCWSLDTFSSSFNNNSSNLGGQQLNLPFDSFVTCSSDNTVRIWSCAASNHYTTTSSSNLKRNIYSKELLKVIYIDNDLSALCEIDPAGDNIDNQAGNQPNQTVVATQQQPLPVTNLPVGSINNLNVNTNELSANSKIGARCLKISPYGKHLATGDRNGNIRVTDLSTLDSIALIEAHDGEVLYLQYSQPESSRLLLASSSRDRLIHIFDASRNTYDLLQTLDDHSASITAVRFCFSSLEKQLYIISCGADKSIMFRTASDSLPMSSSNSTSSSSNVSSSSSSPNFNTTNPAAQFQFVRTSYVAEKQTFYDLNLDPTRNYIYTISQDRIIRTYAIKDGKKLRQFRGSLNEDGYLLKMDIDKTGCLLATSCTDKCVYIWDINTTECVAYLCGHSEVVTDLKFTCDNQHLITVSADGCIFLWRVNNLFNLNHSSNSSGSVSTSSMSSSNNPLANEWQSQRKLSSNYSSSSSSTSNIANLSSSAQNTAQSSFDLFDSDERELPAWARSKLNGNYASNSVSSSIDNAVAELQNEVYTNSSLANNNKLNSADQPRRGRAVWGPILDASLSFMVDNENQSIISSPSSFLEYNSSNEPWIPETDEEAHDDETYTETSIHTTLIHEPSDEPTSSTTVVTNDEKLLLKTNEIQFPSPCVDKEVFQVKQIKEAAAAASSSATSVRKSWICANNEEDLLFNLMNKLNINNSANKAENTSFESDSESTTAPQTPHADQHSKSLVEDAACKTNKSFDFSSPLSRTLLSDTSIKLDCDLENSFRRQSLSARYLMKAQQQQQQQQQQQLNKSFEEKVQTSFSSSSSSSSSSASSVHSSPHLKKDLLNKPPASPTTISEFLKETDEIDIELVNTTSSASSTTSTINGNSTTTNTTNNNNNNNNKNSINIGQMAADLVKMRRKAVQLTSQQSVPATTTQQNSKLLHSHHTESSLNKTKPKQLTTQSTNLKRSPSVNSISNQTNTPINTNAENLLGIPVVGAAAHKNGLLGGGTGGGGDSSASSSSSSIKLNSSNKSKSSPKQTSVNLSNNNNNNNNASTNTTNTNSSSSNSSTDENHLKKAVSMITLFSSQQNTIKSKTTSQRSNTIIQPQQLHQQSQQIQNNLLPPKTVRQLKQRSAERQLTSSAILSNVNNSTNNKPVNPTPLITSNIVANTFNEQKKHLRKLSSSIQNLHNVVASSTSSSSNHSNHHHNHNQIPSTSSLDLTSTSSGVSVSAAVNAFNRLNSTLLPPQVPKSAKSSPTQTKIESKLSNSINIDLTSDDTNEHDTTLNKDQEQEQDKQSSNSLISSSSSSSSSSSCSLFDNVSSISSQSDLKVDSFKSVDDAQLSSQTNKKTSFGMSAFNSRFDTSPSQSASFIQSSSSLVMSSSQTSTSASLKKPITFASIAAAANSGITSPLPITSHVISSPPKFTSFNSVLNTSPLTSNKIDQIIDEFKKNVYLLQLVSNQTPKIAEDLSKFNTSTVGLQQSASHQTIQLMQTFNTTVQSLIYKFNTSLNAIKLQQASSANTNSSNDLNANTNNSEPIKIDNDLEIS